MSHPQPPPGPPRRGGAGAWIKAHKGLTAGAGIAAAVVGVALYERSKSSSSAAADAGNTSSTTGSTGTVQGSYDSSSQDTYDALEQQIADLQSMIGQSTSGGGTANGNPPVASTVNVPSVVSDRVADANSALAALGLKSKFPARKPNVPYWVSGETPGAGTAVAPGSTVTLAITTKQPKG